LSVISDFKPIVLVFGKLPPPYIGPSVATQILLRSKLREEFDIVHFDLSDHRNYKTLGKIDLMNFWIAFRQYFLLPWYLARYRPDLVYMPFGQTTVSYYRDSVFLLLIKLFRKKVVCHLRGGNFDNWYRGASAFTRWYVRRIHSLVDAQIILGENLRHLFNWLMPDSRIFVVPNGGNFPIPEVRKGDGIFRALFLGNLLESKGVVDFLKASEIIALSGYRDTEFVLAGENREARTVEFIDRFIREHPDVRVRMPGPLAGEDKFRLLAECDVLVFPTYYVNEGHPWVIVESMAAGLPVVSTDHAAIPETVSDGENGFLVPKKDPEAIAEKVIRLIEDPELRERMGKRSREIYREKFTEEIMVEKMSSVFHKVLSGLS
jgi:glycosyltransferase involved in cell wall biosynthesis